MAFYRDNGSYNEFLGLPSKFNTVFNRETERFPTERPTETRMDNFPTQWDRYMMENCPWFNRNFNTFNWPANWNGETRWTMFCDRTCNFDRNGHCERHIRWERCNRACNFDRFFRCDRHHMDNWMWTFFCDRNCNFDRMGHCDNHFRWENCNRDCNFDRYFRCEPHHMNNWIWTFLCNRNCNFDRMGHCDDHIRWENCNRNCNFDRFGRCEPHWDNRFNNRMEMWNRPNNWMNTFNRSNNWMNNFGRSNNWMNTFNRSNNWMDTFNRDWFNNTELCNTFFRPCSEAEFYTLRNPIRFYDDRNTRGLWLCFDLRGYKPEEVTVTFNRKERCIVLEAAHETSKDLKEHMVVRKYFRKFNLPEYMKTCDLEKVELNCFFGRDGFFYIEGMLPHMNFDNWPVPTTFPFYGCWRDERFNCGEGRSRHHDRCNWNNDTLPLRKVTCKYL